jgi:hypothetical protein
VTTAVIDIRLLLRVLEIALVAGVGVSIVVSLTVLGMIRSGDMRREQRSVAAGAYALLGLAGVAATAGLIIAGLILLAQKS